MTAHAMKGDRNRCLASGMDGYLSKPIFEKELFQVIDETLAALAQGPAEVPQARAVELFDQTASLQRAGDNQGLLGEMAVLFRADYPLRLREIKEAIARQDSPGVERAAHTLRGAVSNFFAGAAVAASEKLEALGRDGVLSSASAAYDELERALLQLEPELAKLSEEGV